MSVSKDDFFVEVAHNPNNTLSVHTGLCGPPALEQDGCEPRRHVAISGDIWSFHTQRWVVSYGIWSPWCTGQPPKTKHYPAQNVNNTEKPREDYSLGIRNVH